MNPRQTLKRLIKSVDAEGIEFARDEVRPEDVPQLCAYYWTLDNWRQKLALIDLIQDHYHPAMDRVCLDVLRAPGDGNDWVDLPKIVALGILSEDHDNFALYYSDRDKLRAAVDAMLAARGVERDAETTAIPTPSTAGPGAESLFGALIVGDEAQVLKRLANGADPNARRGDAPDGQPALFWAAHHGMAQAVVVMLGDGAEVDAADQYGSTPLIQAATSGHLEVLEALLAAGANPCARISDGRTAINLSIRSGRADVVAALLDAGADLDSPQPTFTPLAFACFEGTTEQVELLIERGADLDRTITYNRFHNVTPLMLAANAGKAKMVEALLAGGADPTLTDDDGKTATDWARGKRADQIRAILAAAAG